jgi:hypothetical protein
MMDRDFPMNRREARILVVGLAVMAVLGILLFGGFLPGLHPTLTTSSFATIGGHQYFVESTPLHIPFAVNSTSPWNVTFHNVTFELWLTNWYSVTGGVVHGIGIEPNGTAYSFTLGATLTNGSRPSLYLSPDLSFGVWWNGGILGGVYAQLLVER